MKRTKSALRRKFILEGLLLFTGLAIGVLGFCWFRVWIVGELDTAQFRQIIDLLPKDWRKFATVDFDWLVSYLGRTSLTLDEPMLISLVCGWSLVRGSDVVSGELGRGTMEMLLAQPISRRQIYLQHALMTVAGLAILVLVAWLGMSLGIWTTSVEETTYPAIHIPVIESRIPLQFLTPRVEIIPMASVVNPLRFFPGLVNLFFVGFCFAGFAMLCSACDRYRWRTLGITTAFYFSNAGLKLLAMGSEKFKWLQHWTIFGFYHPSSSIERVETNPWSPFWLLNYSVEGHIVGLGSLADWGILLMLGCLMFAVGLKVFEKRDLPAPV